MKSRERRRALGKEVRRKMALAFLQHAPSGRNASARVIKQYKDFVWSPGPFGLFRSGAIERAVRALPVSLGGRRLLRSQLRSVRSVLLEVIADYYQEQYRDLLALMKENLNELELALLAEDLHALVEQRVEDE